MGHMQFSSPDLNRLGVVELVAGLRAGAFSATEVVDACVARIVQRDATVRAWIAVAADSARRLAMGVDAALPLCGVPFGVKDVIETAELPTEMGAHCYQGYQPRFDAGTVAQLRLAGGIMLGKTATAEFAGTFPAATCHPLDPSRTPGGSSSGSAAAVADFMVPFALGTQTGGSVLRPAAFCGVVGFKPSYGLYTIAGMKSAAPSFDTIGLIARSVADVALVHATLMNGTPAAALLRAPRVGVFRSHLWPHVEADARQCLEQAVSAFAAAGAEVCEIAIPEGFDRITGERAIINAFERARVLAGEWESARATFSRASFDLCERGFAIPAERYLEARRAVDAFRLRAADLFAQVDVLVTPTTVGVAPAGLESTGDPRLQELWTMLHLPAITVPAGRAPQGPGQGDGPALPLAVQLVGPRYGDAALLAAADWASAVLAAA